MIFKRYYLMLFRIEGRCKMAPIHFPRIFSKRRNFVDPLIFLHLVLKLLQHFCKILKPYLEPILNYWTGTKKLLLKKIASLIKFLYNWRYENFSYRNNIITKIWSDDRMYVQCNLSHLEKYFLAVPWTEIMIS